MQIDELVKQVMDALALTEKRIPIEISARHVHLSQKDVETLFGPGAKLTPKRPLSQTGQFLSEERVRLVGPKGTIDHVAVLGPARKTSQVEISATDTRLLGVSPVLRQSGSTKNSAPLLLTHQNQMVFLDEGCIVAKNHIHMPETDALRLGIQDGDLVQVQVHSPRPLIFDQVLVRVDPSFVLDMHIDFDEANACLCDKDTYGTLILIDQTAPGKKVAG